MNLVLLGPSGVGKGTHAAALSARYQLRHLATGDLFRRNLRQRTALGRLAQKYMAQGDLVPDEVVDAMIEEWADTLAPAEGTLFDGFPRTADQLRFLDQLMMQLGRRLDAAIYLKVDDQEVVDRLAGRLLCAECQATYHIPQRPPQHAGRCDRCGGDLYRRPDDTVQLARARLRIFHRVTEPILAYYGRAGKLLIISGTGSIPAVGDRLVAAIDAVASGAARFATIDQIDSIAPAPPEPVVVPASGAPRIDLVLLGAPGSGKGTQAERLCDRLRIPHIATGDLFRDHFRRETTLGVLAKSYMDRGDLVPDELTDAMVEQRLALSDAYDGFILDGFPRTLPQAHALAEILARLQRRLAGVLHIKVSDATILQRLSGRLICRQCQSPYHALFKPPQQPGRCDLCGGELYQRNDDNPETVRARLTTFHRQTEPLIAHYAAAGLLHAIDGERDVTQITADGMTAISRLDPRVGTSAPRRAGVTS